MTPIFKGTESNLGGKIYSYSNVITKQDVEINADLVSNNLSSNPINDLICEGDTILFDAGASTGAGDINIVTMVFRLELFQPIQQLHLMDFLMERNSL